MNWVRVDHLPNILGQPKEPSWKASIIAEVDTETFGYKAWGHPVLREGLVFFLSQRISPDPEFPYQLLVRCTNSVGASHLLVPSVEAGKEVAEKIWQKYSTAMNALNF